MDNEMHSMSSSMKEPQVSQEALMARYKALMDKKEKLNAKRIELQTTFQHHKSEYQEALNKLQEEFKVASLKEAYQLRDRLTEEANRELEELSKLLSQFDDILVGDSQ